MATPQYGPPAPAPAANDRTTLFGVLGIILAICCWPLGLLFAILSIVQSRKNASSPTLGYVGIALVVVLFIVNIVVYATGNIPGMTK